MAVSGKNVVGNSVMFFNTVDQFVCRKHLQTILPEKMAVFRPDATRNR
jgi:hypothetical protein